MGREVADRAPVGEGLSSFRSLQPTVVLTEAFDEPALPDARVSLFGPGSVRPKTEKEIPLATARVKLRQKGLGVRAVCSVATGQEPAHLVRDPIDVPPGDSAVDVGEFFKERGIGVVVVDRQRGRLESFDDLIPGSSSLSFGRGSYS